MPLLPPNWTPVGSGSEHLSRQVSELKASYQGQSLLRLRETDKLRKSNEEAKKKLLSLEKKNVQATRETRKAVLEAEQATYQLVRSHSALASSCKKLNRAQAEIKKARKAEIKEAKKTTIALSKAESQLKVEEAKVISPRHGL